MVNHPASWHPFSYLGRLSPEARAALLGEGMLKILPAGRVLVRQGEPGRTVYLLTSGRVSVTMTMENGSESLLGVRHPGDLVGEMALFGKGVRSATVTARDRSTFLVFPAEDFTAFLGRFPAAAMAINQMVGDRLNQANAYRAEAAGYDVEVRLARALLYQAERRVARQDGVYVVMLKQAELAMLISVKEVTVQKALNGPAMRDLVRCRRGRVLILDVPGLARLARLDVPAALA